MNKRVVALLVVVMCVAVALPALAQTGNGAPSGPHYNLNIIGVEKGKTADMTNSQRHTIFVALKNGEVPSKIYLTRGEFQVCDGNAFDPAFDCDGNQVQGTGAVFQLPCNTNLPGGEELIPCTQGESAAYEVWARALGSPKDSPYAGMTTCATDPAISEVVCSSENVVKVRERGKSMFTNVTNELTSLVGDIDGDLVAERVALFSAGLVDWFWQYDNQGLKLMQLRFYPVR